MGIESTNKFYYFQLLIIETLIATSNALTDNNELIFLRSMSVEKVKKSDFMDKLPKL